MIPNDTTVFAVCCSSSTSYVTVQSTQSHVQLLQIVTVRVAVRSELTRSTPVHQCIV